jgi:hypothetical protein
VVDPNGDGRRVGSKRVYYEDNAYKEVAKTILKDWTEKKEQ